MFGAIVDAVDSISRCVSERIFRCSDDQTLQAEVLFQGPDSGIGIGFDSCRFTFVDLSREPVNDCYDSNHKKSEDESLFGAIPGFAFGA